MIRRSKGTTCTIEPFSSSHRLHTFKDVIRQRKVENQQRQRAALDTSRVRWKRSFTKRLPRPQRVARSGSERRETPLRDRRLGLRPGCPPQADLGPSSSRTRGTRERSRSKNRPFPFVSTKGSRRNLAPRHVHGLRRLARLPRGACGDARRRAVPRDARDGDQGGYNHLRPRGPGFQPRRRRLSAPRSASSSSPRRRFLRVDPRRRGVGGVLRRVRRSPPHRLRRRVSRQGQGGRGVGAVHRGRGRKRARQSLRDHGRGGSRSRRARAAAPAAAAVRAAAAAHAAAAARAATATSSTATTTSSTATTTTTHAAAAAAAYPTPPPSAAATTTPFDAEPIGRPRRGVYRVRPARLLRLRGVQVQGGV